MKRHLLYVLLILLGLPFPTSLTYADAWMDDFEDGDAKSWKEIGGKWKVEEGAYVQFGKAADPNLIFRSLAQTPWQFTDGSIEVKFRFDRQSKGDEIALVLYRMVDDDSGYAVRLLKNALEVGRLDKGIYSAIRNEPSDINIAKPISLKLEPEGLWVKVHYNGVLKMRIGDANFEKNGYKKGKVGLGVSGATSPVYFDEILVEGEGVRPSPPQSVQPKGKLPIVWGYIKRNQEK